MQTNMDTFCGSPLWNSTLIWKVENPDFTICFQRTFLQWIPCIFLWIFSPLEMFYLVSSKNKVVPWKFLNVCKLTITFLLCCIWVEDVINVVTFTDATTKHPVDYISPLIVFISYLLAGSLSSLNVKRGLVTSGLLFLFFLMMFIVSGIQIRSQFITNTYTSYSFIKNIINFILLTIQVILHCWADKRIHDYEASRKNKCPELEASALSKWTYAWFNKMMWLGYKRPLRTEDLWTINDNDKSQEIFFHFSKFLVGSGRDKTISSKKKTRMIKDYESNTVKFIKNEMEGQVRCRVSILFIICKAFGPMFLFGSGLKIFSDLLTFVNPQILRLVISFVKSEDPMWYGYFYSIIMFGSCIIQTIILSQYFQRMFIVGLHMRSALISAIYRKTLRLSNSSRMKTTVGEIVNLMSVDAQRLMDLVVYLNTVWSAPFQIGLAMFFLFDLLGSSALFGFGVMIILIPINGFIVSKNKKLQTKQMNKKDERLKLMNEVLNGMKVLKLFAWEKSFEEQVMKIRNEELRILKQVAYLSAATSFVWSCAPFLVSLISFATYVLSGHILDAKTAFGSLCLFNILRFPLSMLPSIISSLVQASVSIKRLNNFLNADELDPNAVTHHDSETYSLQIENASFSWGDSESLKLHSINLKIKYGQLVAIIGPVGSGKSCILNAVLGEMDKVTGKVNTTGKLAYVAQQAWIQNRTLRENITFGKPFNEIKYNKIIDSCALRADLEMLPAGDLTEIGEKGINLSGGQKQRVSLARAIYSDSDIYLLDDPLSAVDAHVGKHIFDNVIGPHGILQTKTRILATHNITYLSQVDYIVVVKEGNLIETGSYKELVEKNGVFAQFLTQYIGVNNKEESLEPKQANKPLCEGSLLKGEIKSKDIESKNYQDRLIEEEKAETGKVKFGVYEYYLKCMGKRIQGILSVTVQYQVCSVTADIWLSKWSSDEKTQHNDSLRDLYLGLYGGIGILITISALCSSILLFIGTLDAAGILHGNLIRNILRLPMSFFDTTPIGRIINRFSKDVDVLDTVLPHTIRGWSMCFLSVLGTIAVISYTTPMFLAVVLPLCAAFFFIQQFYVATSRQLKRIESISRSPIYSHFSDTITGASTIRAFSVQQRFIGESEEKVDLNRACYYPSIIANRWLAVRLETIGTLIIFTSSLLAVLSRGLIEPGQVGLSLTYALSITQTLNWLVRMSAEMESNIVAVERIKEYSELQQEAPWEILEKKPPDDWPNKGEIHFYDYAARYREGLDLTLDGISCYIHGGEKIGIVGRTGSGKSTLTLGLFRIIEPADGKIVIDDMDISLMGLGDLRTRLTIIPQDPILFSGNLRLNLDPFGIHTDEELWCALDHAHLKDVVKSFSKGLLHELAEGGKNLSAGQRQLVCLARALLKKSKILILDEATAAIDLETDDFIQRTIRDKFKECTVVTIAHRLHTVMDSDRIMVLDKGEIVELDSPKILLTQKSYFASLVAESEKTQ